MSVGISRSRTYEFLRAKGSKKQSKKRFSRASLNKTYEDEELIKSSLLSTKASEVEMQSISEPLWVEDYKDCCFLIKEVEICRDEIKKEHAQKLKSAKEAVHEQRIQFLTDEATDKLKKCQTKLKAIELANSSNVNEQERKIFTNIIIALADKIRQAAKALRQDRQQELSHERELQKFNDTELSQELRRTAENSEDSSWLSEDNMEVLEERLNSQRNEEIMKIVKSIHSLNTIYKELAEVVIHQGSLLDRIDENINKTYQRVQQGVQHLKKAEEHQKSPFAKKVIFVLITLIFIFFGIFMLRHS